LADLANALANRRHSFSAPEIRLTDRVFNLQTRPDSHAPSTNPTPGDKTRVANAASSNPGSYNDHGTGTMQGLES